MFPIHILNEGVKLPDHGTFYIIARNGVFLRKETGIISATVKVERISFLEEMTPSVQLQLPKIPAHLFVRTLLFFRRVYQRYGSEAAVLLHYNVQQKDYQLVCPDQQVDAGSVRYEAHERFPGYRLVGSIHSHAGGSAFHSAADRNDEKSFDGVHITIGRLDQPYFGLMCSVVVNDNRFPAKPEDLIDGIKSIEWKPRQSPTYRRLDIQRTALQSLGFMPAMESDLSFHNRYSFRKTEADIFYDAVLPDNQDYRHVGFPTSWMDRVQHHFFSIATILS